jgi:predicted PurR-regulated permease PerM
MQSNTANQSGSFSKNQVLSTAIVLLTALAIYLFYVVAKPFISPLIWAMAFAILGFPLFRKILGVVKNRSAAAGITSAAIAFVVIVPIIVVSRQVFVELWRNYASLKDLVSTGGWRAPFERSELTNNILVWLESQFALDSTVARMTEMVPTVISTILSGSATVVFEGAVALVALFFFFRDSDSILRGVRTLMPLTKVETDRFFQRVDDTMHATVFGEILISAITGTLGGLAFWALGLQAPVLWGFVMGLLAFLPILGTWLVWLPAALLLFVNDRWIAGILLIVWGVVVMTALTSLLYPKLVGDRLRLHTFLVFIALIGGLTAFGLIGAIVGPLILALTVELLEIWRKRLGLSNADIEIVHE